MGSEIRGDIVSHGRYLVAHTAAGAVVAMTPFGQPYWQAALGGGLDSSPCVAADQVYSVTNNGILYARDLTTGAVRWSRPINGGLLFGAAPASDGKNVYVATATGKVYAFSAAGDKIWMKDIGVAVYATPLVSGDMLLFGSDAARLMALDLAEGSVRWQANVGSRVVSSTPLVYDGLAVIGTYGGAVMAFSLKKGGQVWSFKTGGSVVGNPVLAAGRLYAGSKDGLVYALDPATGAKVWSFNTGAPVVASPVFANGRVYVPAGTVFFSLLAETGTPEWNYQLGAEPKKPPWLLTVIPFLVPALKLYHYATICIILYNNNSL
jgi:outer membrane protein assembly factor BamB